MCPEKWRALIKENEEWGWSEPSATRLSNSVIRESKHDVYKIKYFKCLLGDKKHLKLKLGCFNTSHTLQRQWRLILPQADLSNVDIWLSYLTSFPLKRQKGQAVSRTATSYTTEAGPVCKLKFSHLMSNVEKSERRGKVSEWLSSEEFPIMLSKQELEFDL